MSDRLLTQLQETGSIPTGFSLYYLIALCEELGIDLRTVKLVGEARMAVPQKVS